MARIFSYHDTHLHRIGPNYEQLPINRPQCPVHSYNKDGQMTYHHAGDQPVYAPNSYGGPAADPAKGTEIGWDVDAAELGAHGLREARRRRRLLPAGDARARGDGRRGPRGARGEHRRPRLRRGVAGDAAARDRLLVARRRADRRARRRRAGALQRRPRRARSCAPRRSWSTRAPARPRRSAGTRRPPPRRGRRSTRPP